MSMRVVKFLPVFFLTAVAILSTYAIQKSKGEVNSKLEEQILNDDYNVANRALDEAKKSKNAVAVRLGLRHRSLTLRKQAAESLKELKDKASVPSLIKALEDNQVVYRGGTETEILQGELNNAIISALQELTGINFSTEAASTKDNIQKIILCSRQWWAENKGKVNK